MLFRCLIALGVGMAVALPLAPYLLDLLKVPLGRLVEDPDRFLLSMEVAGALTVMLRLSFWAGLLFGSPFILFFVGDFVFPGLKPHERGLVRKTGGFAVLLFTCGVILGYFITLPVALKVMFQLHDWMGIAMMPRVTNYITFTTQLLMGFGLAFEMPVVVVLLGKLGLLTHAQLRARRKHVMMGILVLAMALTPPDIFTQLIMAVPLMALYETCIWIIWMTEKKADRKKE